jgi:hypothetical protein
MGTPVLYAILSWMERRGLIARTEEAGGGRGRPKVVYRLTPKGGALLPFKVNASLPPSEVRFRYNSRFLCYDLGEARFPLSRFIDELKLRRLMPLLPRNRAVPILDAGGGTGKWSIRVAMARCKPSLPRIQIGF